MTTPANPNNLSDETVGVKYGWRLLDVDEVTDGPKLAEIEIWIPGEKSWAKHCRGQFKDSTYRTRLTRAELRTARRRPPEQPDVSESLRAEVARLEEALGDAKASLLHRSKADDQKEGLYWGIDLQEKKQQLTTALATVEELRKEQNRGNHTCSICNWSNTGCCNVGEPNGEPIWMCHGCIKREHDQVSALTQQLREAQAANASKDDALRDSCSLIGSLSSACLQVACALDKFDWPYIFSAPHNGGDRNTKLIRELIEQCLTANKTVATKQVAALSPTCGQPILNEIDALKKDRDEWHEKACVFESQVENADATLEQVKMAMKSNHARELDAVKKERDEQRERAATHSEYSRDFDRIRAQLIATVSERDTALRSLADANARLASYDEINAELTRMHSEACDQRNEAQRSLATMKDQNAVLLFNFLASQKENSKLSGILINQKQEIELLQKSEAATAVLREAIGKFFNPESFADLLYNIGWNARNDAQHERLKFELEQFFIGLDGLSTTPVSDLLADKARLDVIDSEGILIMSSSATQFTVLTGDGESADETDSEAAIADRDAYREALVLSETTRHEWAERAIAGKADRDRLADENAQLRAALDECPWPADVFTCTVEKLIELVPDGAQRTAIAGLLCRMGWERAQEALRTGGAK